ncbi:ABC transporter substrate-binding protein [Haloplasma contractile]|nr:ABC transporter substrate-binding protein [Haloplasma contractile]
MKKIIFMFLSISMFLLIVACGNGTPEKETIKIGFMPSLGAVPYVYALEEGLYEEAGLDVEIRIFMNANERDAAVIGGHLDGMNTDYVMLGHNLENDVDLIVTAKTEEKFMLVANQAYTETDLSETDGAKVGTFENGILDYLVTKIAEENSVSYTKVGIPSVPARKAALVTDPSNDGLHMAILPDPFATLAGGTKMWNNIDEELNVTSLVFRKEFVDEHGDALRKFFNTTDDAINELKTKEYNEYKSYIVKHNILTADTVDLVTVQEFHNLELPDQTQFNNVMAWMYENDLITEEYRLNDLTFNWKE